MRWRIAARFSETFFIKSAGDAFGFCCLYCCTFSDASVMKACSLSFWSSDRFSWPPILFSSLNTVSRSSGVRDIGLLLLCPGFLISRLEKSCSQSWVGNQPNRSGKVYARKESASPVNTTSFSSHTCTAPSSISSNIVRIEGSSEMSSLALLQSLKDTIITQANVKSVYGEPIAAQGKTIVPVAKIIYGYGAGAGTGGMGDSKARGEGGGGGGAARAIPVGVVEIADQQTRFVPISDRKKLTGAVAAGIALGLWLSWRRRH